MDFIEHVKSQLEENELLREVSAKTGLAKEQICLGAASAVFIVVFLGFGMPFVCNLVGFVPGAIIAIRAFENKNIAAAEKIFLKKNWMTFLIINGFFYSIECFSNALLRILPFYHAIKLAVLLWCMSPSWRGGALSCR